MKGAKINKIVKYIKSDIDRFLLVCLSFSLPFERIPSFELLGVSVRLSLIFSFLIISRALYQLLVKKTRLILSSQDKLLLAFMIWIILIIPVSINLSRALTVVLFTIFVILTAFSISIIFKKEYFKHIAISLFAATVFVVLFGAFQYLGDIFNLPGSITGLRERYSWAVFGFPRIQAFSLEPLYMAAFLLLPYSIAVVMFLTKDKICKISIQILIIALASFAIFMSVSRGGIYAMLFASLFISFYLIATKKSSSILALKLLGIIACSFLVSLIIINYFNKTPSAFTKGKKGGSAFVDQVKNTSIGEGDERSQSRALAINILNENKSSYLVGIGPGQFGPYAQDNLVSDNGWTIVNNMPIEILLETGSVGVALLILFFISIILKTNKILINAKDKITFLIVLSIWTYLAAQAIQVQTYSTLYILYLWLPVGIILALLRNRPNKNG